MDLVSLVKMRCFFCLGDSKRSKEKGRKKQVVHFLEEASFASRFFACWSL